MKSRSPSGVDGALQLEAIYYSAPVPRNACVLTVLGTVFDKIYFPGVYIPKDGFDQAAVDKEIARIEALTGPSRNRDGLLGVLRLVQYARTLDGFCVFTGDRQNPFPDMAPERMAKDVYEAIHGPSPPEWQPMLPTNFSKALPGGNEFIAFPGDYHYMAGTLLESARAGVPLLNDIPGLPIPGFEETTLAFDSKALSAILALECVRLALPELPLLRPEDLMEFREANTTTLRAFRRSMLRYAAELNGAIRGLPAGEIEDATKFFVDTEIVPVLDELRSTMHGPARPWYKRAVDLIKVVPELGTAFMTLDPTTAIAKVMTTYAGQFFAEVMAKGEQREALKRSGLYYLLRLQTYQSEHLP
jgi:hypothetical protein